MALADAITVKIAVKIVALIITVAEPHQFVDTMKSNQTWDSVESCETQIAQQMQFLQAQLDAKYGPQFKVAKMKCEVQGQEASDAPQRYGAGRSQCRPLEASELSP